MFTGLVEGVGRIDRIEVEAAGIRLELVPPRLLIVDETGRGAPVGTGDSIAINGCCLTLVAWGDGRWSFQAGEETLSKTNMGLLEPGDCVNLERSLPAQGRIGGHFVQGHIDGTGIVDQLDRDADWLTMGIRVPASIADLMVAKGSVAVDGVSLTVVSVEAERFTLALIPHTLAATTLGQQALGRTVNIETDILGKYVKKMMTGLQRSL